MSNIVEKKAWPELFEAVSSGNKTFDLRLADFEIAPGDTLKLREWDPHTKEYTGREFSKTVGYVGKVSDLTRMYDQTELDSHGLIVISLK